MRVSLAVSVLVGLLAANAEPLVRMELEEPAQQHPALALWSSAGPTPSDQRIELTFAVKQRNVEELERTLMRVSTPTSAEYGKHLSNEEVHALVAPRPEDVRAVKAFLKRHGVEGVALTPNEDMIRATVTAKAAEQMLSASYVRLVHQNSTTAIDRCLGGYSLPQDVAAAVDFVAPTIHIPPTPQMPRFEEVGTQSPRWAENTPKNLRELYEVSAEGTADKNKQAVTAFLGQYYSPSDLQSFWKKYCGGIHCGKGLPGTVGDATTGRPGVEAMLDIEYITGLGGNIETEFWGFSGSSPDNSANEPFMKWLAQVSNTSDDKVPKIFSSSYGEDERSWSQKAASRLNTEFKKAGVRGISLLFASGDSGANCKESKFYPQMPASSPWVTAVGGTKPASGYPSPGSEAAVGLSSGGFSNYWTMPTWQKEAVAGYLSQSGLPSAETWGFNTSGRAFPDISAQASSFCVIPGGCFVSGTSCATPTASGVLGLINDLRIAKGESSLGFLNPFLYQHADAFTDITTGSSSGCGFFGGDGWPAKKGWDAVTGLGTPNYKSLAKLAMSLSMSSPHAPRADSDSDSAALVV